MSNPVFEAVFTALPEHIDELGHVNNTVWVKWIQDMSVAHWQEVAADSHKLRYHWVVVRHEIDYLRPAMEGDRLRARTWVGDSPKGARFARFVEFIDSDERVCVRSKTQWAIVDNALGRPIRVPPDVVAPFVSPE